MLRSIGLAMALTLMLLGSCTARAAEQYATTADAKAHCPKDTVVWLNLPSGVYHFAGERWYGKTKDGAFVCKKKADAEGDRATKNGQ